MKKKTTWTGRSAVALDGSKHECWKMHMMPSRATALLHNAFNKMSKLFFHDY